MFLGRVSIIVFVQTFFDFGTLTYNYRTISDDFSIFFWRQTLWLNLFFACDSRISEQYLEKNCGEWPFWI